MSPTCSVCDQPADMFSGGQWICDRCDDACRFDEAREEVERIAREDFRNAGLLSDVSAGHPDRFR